LSQSIGSSACADIGGGTSHPSGPGGSGGRSVSGSLVTEQATRSEQTNTHPRQCAKPSDLRCRSGNLLTCEVPPGRISEHLARAGNRDGLCRYPVRPCRGRFNAGSDK
jgi:hypothetical protein